MRNGVRTVEGKDKFKNVLNIKEEINSPKLRRLPRPYVLL